MVSTIGIYIPEAFSDTLLEPTLKMILKAATFFPSPSSKSARSYGDTISWMPRLIPERALTPISLVNRLTSEKIGEYRVYRKTEHHPISGVHSMLDASGC